MEELLLPISNKYGRQIQYHRASAIVLLTNQSKATFKLISTVAAQMATPKEIENLRMEEIVAFVDEQYDSRKFIVQERFQVLVPNTK